MKNISLFIPILLLAILVVCNLLFGTINISLNNLLSNKDNIQQWVLINDRIPRTIIAIISGVNLVLAGTLMQTIFKNPLAGPTTLGINSGASLGVAFFIFIGEFVNLSFTSLTLTGFAFIGAMAFLSLLLIFHSKFKSISTLLIIGLMLGYVSFALIEIMIKFSNSEAIKNYVFWGMGSFDKSTWQAVALFIPTSLLTLVYVIKKRETFNLMLLGDDELILNGKSPKKERMYIFIIVGILISIVTAYIGPLAFIGVAIPNAVKMISKRSNHTYIFKHALLWGAIFTVLADFLTRGVLFDVILPVNAILSLLSMPIIFIFLLKNKSHGN